jgi:hypothetical protein
LRIEQPTSPKLIQRWRKTGVPGIKPPKTRLEWTEGKY